MSSTNELPGQRMYLKRVLALILGPILSLAFVLTGCSDGSGSEQQTVRINTTGNKLADLEELVPLPGEPVGTFWAIEERGGSSQGRIDVPGPAD